MRNGVRKETGKGMKMQGKKGFCRIGRKKGERLEICKRMGVKKAKQAIPRRWAGNGLGGFIYLCHVLIRLIVIFLGVLLDVRF